MRLEITDDVHSAAEVMERARRVAVLRGQIPKAQIVQRPVVFMLPDLPAPPSIIEEIAAPQNGPPAEIPIELLRRLANPIRPGCYSIDAIITVAAFYFNVSRTDLISHRRMHIIVRMRHIAMYVARKVTTRSLPEIGRRFGGRDHTSAMHACARIAGLIANNDEKTIADVTAIEKIVRGESPEIVRTGSEQLAD